MRRKLVYAVATAALALALFAAPVSAHFGSGGHTNPWLQQWCQTNPSYSRCP